MKIEAYNPYFNDAHDEFVELIRWVPDRYWDAKPAHIDAPTVRQIATRLIDDERFWIVHIAQKGPWERATGADFPTQEHVIDGLLAARAATMRYVEFLEPAGLKAVRRIPPDASRNRPEVNQPIGWILWQVVKNDIYALGQLAIRMTD